MKLSTEMRVSEAREHLLKPMLPEMDALEFADFESYSSAVGLPHKDDLLNRVESVLIKIPEDEMGDPKEFKQALSTLLEFGDKALLKLVQPPELSQTLTPDELKSAEAIIATNGSRPSFLLRSGFVRKDHPFLNEWQDEVSSYGIAASVVSRCVGRIEPRYGSASNFFGTGVLLDRAQGLVLTNFHVVEEAKKWLKPKSDTSGKVLKFERDLFIDFAGEIDSYNKQLFPVVEAYYPERANVGFDGIDLAVLRLGVGELTFSSLPDPAIRISNDPAYTLGITQTLCTIGFPGPPVKEDPVGTKIDWNYVVRVLMGNKFGLKRLAPGRFRKMPGLHEDDQAGIAITHDATTFQGASGSPVLAWEDDGAPAFAIHFGGETNQENWAISLAKVKKELDSLLRSI